MGAGRITEREKNEVSLKSGPKKKESVSKKSQSKEKDLLFNSSRDPPLGATGIVRNKSPIKFKPMTSVKSAGNLKGS